MAVKITKNLSTYFAYIPWMLSGVLITACVHGFIYWYNHTEETHIFVHIPKTGGTALNQWIDQQHLRNQCKTIRSAHTHYLDTEHAIRLGYHPITIIRHPIERFVSSFYYWKFGSKDIAAWRRTQQWDKADGIETPNDLIDILKNPKHARYQSTVDAVFSRHEFTHRHHFLPQTLWLKDHTEQTIVICYDAQTLSHNIQTTLARHGIDCPIEQLPNINQSITPPQKPKLTKESRQWLEDLYADDMALWATHCQRSASRTP